AKSPIGAVSSFIASREFFDESKSERHSRALISQASAAAPPTAKHVMVYADHRNGRETLLSLVNPATQQTSVKFSLRDSAGKIMKEVTHEIARGSQLRVATSELGATTTASTLTIESTSPVYVTAMGTIKNERSEQLLRPIPVSYDRHITGMSRYAIPGVKNG